MIKTYKIFILVVSATLILVGCKTKEHVAAIKGKPAFANAPVIIYKTKLDYSLQVPVTLSTDKKSLTSYPAPSDVFYNGDLAYPVILENGFLLDRRGITVNSAFTKWTYYEYSRLPNTPSEEEIFKMMLDTDPFTEIYYCGTRADFKDLQNELNKAIQKNQLDNYKKLK